MGAVMNVDPSLINFLGGYGRAFGAIGKSMTDINQAKLDLDQQERDNTSKNAYLELQKKNTQLGIDNANYVKQKDFETRNDKLNTNANTNALILGEAAPTEMSNRYAQLSLVDPAVTAAMAKTDKEKYSGTAGGIIFNTSTGQIAGDYRDKDAGSLKDYPSMDTLVGGKPARNFFLPDGTVKTIMANGTALPIATQDHANGIMYGRQNDFPVINNNVTQGISAGNAIQSGGLPVRLSNDPKVAKAQRAYLYPTAGGGWYVPTNLVDQYKKQFPQ